MAHSKLLAAALVSGLLAGNAMASDHAAKDAKPAVKAEKKKGSCGGKDGCKGKESKNHCEGKDHCKGEDGEAKHE